MKWIWGSFRIAGDGLDAYMDEEPAANDEDKHGGIGDGLEEHP